METRARLLGHPVHPMLIVFPLGLLGTAAIFDVIYAIWRVEELAVFAFWATAAGIVGGLLAAPFGLWDWLAIPKRTRAKEIGLVHGVGNVVVLALFAWSWVLRLDAAAYLPDLLPMVLALAGLAVALFTAWQGGELVYRLRVAVDDDAHLDASTSLRRGTAEMERSA